MKTLAITLLITATALTGCFPTPEEIRAADNSACLSYGFTPGTVDWAHCLQQRDSDRAAAWQAQMTRNQAQNDARQAAWAQQESAQQAQLMQQHQRQVDQMHQRQREWRQENVRW